MNIKVIDKNPQGKLIAMRLYQICSILLYS